MRTRWGASRGADDDAGQVALLVLGYAVLALVVVLALSAASAVHLERKRLWAAADAAAVDAADAVDEASYYSDGATLGTGVPLTDAGVRASVEEQLRTSGAFARTEGLRVGPGTGTPDGRTAQVQLLATPRVPVLGLLPGTAVVGGPFQISVTSRARTALGPG